MKFIINYIRSNIYFSLYALLLIVGFGLALFQPDLSGITKSNDKRVLSVNIDPANYYEISDISSFSSQDYSKETDKLIKLAENSRKNYVDPRSSIRLSSKTYPNLDELVENNVDNTPIPHNCSVSEKSYIDQELIKLETNFENSNNLKIDALEICNNQMNELKSLYVEECDKALIRCERESSGCKSGFTACIKAASELYDPFVCKTDFGSDENIFSEVANIFYEDVQLFKYLRDSCK